jgi:hypothetical protein
MNDKDCESLRSNTALIQREIGQKYLAEADQHLAEAKARTATLKSCIASLEAQDHDADLVRDALKNLEATVQLMTDYKALIARIIA